MEKIEISAEERQGEGGSSKKMSALGRVPGVVYGHGFDNVSISVEQREFTRVLNAAGESSLIDLKVGGKELGKVVIKDYQTDPITGVVLHFDLHKVKMTDKLIVPVELVFIGESPAVKNEGGVLVTGMDSLEIKCLPADLISEIEVDLGRLEHLEDMIRVKDLILSDKLEVLDEEENVIVSVEAPRSEEEIQDLEGKVEEDVNKVEGAVKEEKVEAAAEEEKK